MYLIKLQYDFLTMTMYNFERTLQKSFLKVSVSLMVALQKFGRKSVFFFFGIKRYAYVSKDTVSDVVSE